MVIGEHSMSRNDVISYHPRGSGLVLLLLCYTLQRSCFLPQIPLRCFSSSTISIAHWTVHDNDDHDTSRSDDAASADRGM